VLNSQSSDVETRINNGELKMTFPSIYFKNGSTDYAGMPYTTDSCFKYIADHVKFLNDLNVWRDSSETDQLTYLRIKKLRADLNKYTSAKLNIRSIGNAQKISRRTIYSGTDSSQIRYLLSLNSVFDVSGSIRKRKKYHCLICRIQAEW
jgi:hypothetical protein